MPPRLSRLLQDWKTYAALVAGGSAMLTALTDFANKLTATLASWGIELAQAKLALAGAFALLALLMLWIALARRSVLLRPERFRISDKEPRHLVGREAQVEKLAEECAKSPLTILKGESGAGKSALVRAGLLPYLESAAGGRLLPLRVDASGLDWDGGLRMALAQELAAWPDERRRQLGDHAAPAASAALFAWLDGLPELAPKRLLLILDQIDDYFVAHREHFIDADIVVKPDALERANPDWAALAGLVRRKRLHLLLVCRKDEDMLSALHFRPDPSYFPLARIEANLISPLLDHITQADANGEVVDDPEAGWLQLKARLLRDLSDGGQILPIRLTLALESLRGFRYLTLAQYSKQGGARGLDRLYVEKHLRDAKNEFGCDPAALLRALVLLAEEDGSKTRRATLADFAAALAIKDTAALLDFLEQNHLLRRQSGKDSEFLLLYHDYLARGVRDAYKQANHWTELLRAKAKEFDEALTWRQRWQALLPLRDQIGLLAARLRGRFTYGAYRALAGWSVLRSLPLVLALALIAVVGGWADAIRQEQAAAEVLSQIGDGRIEQDEVAAWRVLANARTHARFHAVRRVVSNPAILARLRGKTAVLFHAALGFDPQGRFSAQIGDTVFLSALRRTDIKSPDLVGIVYLAEQLHLPAGSPILKAIAEACVKRMETEPDNYNLTNLGNALATLGGKLDAQDVKPFADALAGRMKTESDSYRLTSLGKTLAALGGKLDAQDAKPLAEALAERMKTEPDSRLLANLGEALAALGGKLDAKDLKPLAEALAGRMKTEPDSDNLAILGKALGALGGKLDAKDVKPLADALAERMKTEPDSYRLAELDNTLAALGGKLDAQDAKPLAEALAGRMKTEPDSDNLAILGNTLAALGDKLDAKDLKPGADALAERMKTEPDSRLLASLGEALAALDGKLDAKDLKPGADALAERMKTELDSLLLASLGEALAVLGGKLDAKDLKPGADALAERMKTEPDSGNLAGLSEALAALGGKLDAQDVKPLAEALAGRMKTEPDSYGLASLGKALAALGNKLEAKDLKPFAEALAGRMKTEPNSYNLASLSETLAALGGKLDAQDAKPLAEALAGRMKTEPDSYGLASLGKALAALCGKLDAQDVKPLAEALVGRMKTDSESDNLKRLGEALAALGGKLDAQDVKPLAEALAERMKTEPNSNNLASLSETLAALGGTLDARDAKPLAEALAERMKIEPDSDNLAILGNTLATLGGKLEAKDLRPGADVLTERMKTEPDSRNLARLGNTLAALGGKLEAKDLRPGADVLTERMKTEPDSDNLASLGNTLAALGGKFDAKDLRPGAEALAGRMKTEPDRYSLVNLGKALAALGGKLDAENAKPILDMLAKRLRTDPGDISSLATPWATLEPIANADKAPQARIAEYVEFLRDPLMVDKPQKALLDGLGKITNQDFHGNLWQFVDWAQTEEGRKRVPRLQ